VNRQDAKDAMMGTARMHGGAPILRTGTGAGHAGLTFAIDILVRDGKLAPIHA
jgi:hypothetical protein